MHGPTRTVTAKQAAQMLGISVPTLYAYVSRGLLRSEPGAAGARTRRYRLEDIEALHTRKEYRREPARAAGTALDFGMPVLDSAITLIEDGRLFYRGYDVVALAQERSFEEVAALLWTGEFAAGPLFENAGSAPPPIVTPLGNLAGPIELYQAALALTAPDDLAAHQYTPSAVARTGARILRLLTQATVQASGEQAPDRSVAGTLRRAWASEHTEAAALLSAALVLCADHELNVSAFTARCVASAGSTPYAVVIAALSALQGYKHGGHTAQTAALLAAASSGVRTTIAGYLRAGATIPGFGHVLYPEGDPRARHLLALLY